MSTDLKFFAEGFSASANLKQVISNDEAVLMALARISDVCIDALADGHTIYFFGNGGSAADAQHIAAELVGTFLDKERPALRAMALTTDTSILTSVSNDLGYDKIFARQIEGLGRSGDVAIGISTSGNSPNVLAGLQAARNKGLVTVGWTGKGGGEVAACVDHLFAVPHTSTPRIQEIHITAGHLLCEAIENAWNTGRIKVNQR